MYSLRVLFISGLRGVDDDKGTLLGTPNGEPQEYSRNIMEYEDPGRYIPIICLLYSWGSLFGVPSRVPLDEWEGIMLLVLLPSFAYLNPQIEIS